MRQRSIVGSSLGAVVAGALVLCWAASASDRSLATERSLATDPSWPAVVQAADGSAPALSAALGQLPADGGIVVVPPGHWIWSPADELIVDRDRITILGAGDHQTTIVRPRSSNKVAFIRAQAVRDLRVSGISFVGETIPGNTVLDYGIELQDVDPFRVDHCSFSYQGFAGVRTSGDSAGVVDHCTFHRHFKPAARSFGYGVVVYGDDTITGEPFGSARATFVEDCRMSLCRHAVAANRGGRYVFRYSRVTANTKAHAVDAHGREFSDDDTVGTEWIEVYGNTCDNPDLANSTSPNKYAVRVRGGAAVVWNNLFGGTFEGVRVDELTPQDTGPVYVWDNVLGSAPGRRRTPDYCAPTPNDDHTVCARIADPEQIAPPADGLPVVIRASPEGYVPYPYPHPLAAGQPAGAGPDREVLLPAGQESVRIQLPLGPSSTSAVATSADIPTSAATPASAATAADPPRRWFLDGTPLTDIDAQGWIDVPPGRHALVAVEPRPDGRFDADVAVLDVLD